MTCRTFGIQIIKVEMYKNHHASSVKNIIANLLRRGGISHILLMLSTCEFEIWYMHKQKKYAVSVIAKNIY